MTCIARFFHLSRALSVGHALLFPILHVNVSLKIFIVCNNHLPPMSCFQWPVFLHYWSTCVHLVERRVSRLFSKWQFLMVSKLQLPQAWECFGSSYSFGKVSIWKLETWFLMNSFKGSIYKLLWAQIAIYLALYFALSLTYRLALDEYGRVRPWLNFDSTTKLQLYRIDLNNIVWRLKNIQIWSLSLLCLDSMSGKKCYVNVQKHCLSIEHRY